MTFLIGMPAGAEWIFIVFVICLFPLPILTLILYIRNRELKRQIKRLTDERMTLIQKLPDVN